MSTLPTTPTKKSIPYTGNLPTNPPTPEQVRRTEEARLRAKALQTQQDATNLCLNPSTKRSHAEISSTDASAGRNDLQLSVSAADKQHIVRPAKSLASSYIDYDLSRMTDTKGGFISTVDDPHNRALIGFNTSKNNAPLPTNASNLADAAASGKPAGMTMEDWERLQLLKKLRASRSGPFEPTISVMADKKEGTICRDCESPDVDWKWIEIFGIAVCRACKKDLPDKYSLLTKTEAREDYLLKDGELQDKDLLPHLKKPNPHKATWNDMQLYLRCQVEEYAFSDRKWGSPEALDAEFEARQIDKRVKKEKKFKKKLLDLKKKTRTEAYRRNREQGPDAVAQFGTTIGTEEHIHEWSRSTLDPSTGAELKKCLGCGNECEEFDLG